MNGGALLNVVGPNDKQYIGKPCKRGHSGLRLRSNRGCVECRREWHRAENMTPERVAKRREQKREWHRKKYHTDPAYAERKRIASRQQYQYHPEVIRERNARKIEMRAGGVKFYLGYAPTIEDAQRLRRKIKEEAPK